MTHPAAPSIKKRLLQNESFAAAIFFLRLCAEMWKNNQHFFKKQDSKAKARHFCLSFVKGVFSFLRSTLLVVQKDGFEDGFPSILPTAF